MTNGPASAILEKPERLSPEDAARWSMATPKNPMVIGALLLFEQRLPIEALEGIVRTKLVPHRRFRQHVVEPEHRFGRPCWRDDRAFEIRAHVRKLSSPEVAPGAALAALIGERTSAPLPTDLSPWSLELVDLTAGGTAVIGRFQHCLADGRALVSLLDEIADELGAGAPTPSATPLRYGLVRRGGFFDRVARLCRFLAMSADPPGLLRRPLSGQKRVAWSASIPIESVKSIARARNHHVADVLLAGVAGALRRYASDHGEVPRSVRALLPMATPGPASADGVGNHYASVFVSLPVTAADPQARLEMIGRDTAARRGGRELGMAIGLTRLAGALAPALERWAMRWWARRASLVISNLAGPTVPVGLAQRRVQSIVVWAPAAASIGLSVTLFGYAGSLQMGVLADRSVIEHPEELVAGFQAAIDELGGGALPNSP